MKNENKFCTVPEAAKKFGVDRKTMYRWVTDGKINSIVTPGGHHRILCSEIDMLLEKNAFSKGTATRERSILVVDDDEAVRKTFQQKLTRENYSVETSSNGFEAGIKARDIKPDLIILDLMMEGGDGFDTCRVIKRDKLLKKSKILIITGYDTPENREKILQEGADDYMSKGVPFENILKRIHLLLDM